jgi:transposase
MVSIIGKAPPRTWGPRVEYSAVKAMLLEGKTPAQMHEENKMISRSYFTHLWDHWRLHEELPYETRVWESKYKSTQRMTSGVGMVLKDLALTHPSWYLDEYSKWLMDGGYGTFHPATISRKLREEGLTLAVLDEIAKQRNAEERARFLEEIHSVSNLDQFVCIDETHRDRSASRRRRGWGVKGKAHKLYKRWHGYRNELLYTMIGAVDLNGFIPEACKLIIKPETVTIDVFVNYVRECLLPILGNYLHGEPRSVVTIDNASVHHPEVVEALINGAGARVIWTARYSPDLHPIETCFHQYKADLKRSSIGITNLFETHLSALRSVSSTNMRNYYASQWGFGNTEDDGELAVLMMILFD